MEILAEVKNLLGKVGYNCANTRRGMKKHATLFGGADVTETHIRFQQTFQNFILLGAKR